MSSSCDAVFAKMFDDGYINEATIKTALNACKVGENVIDNQEWVPLDLRYPNIKGALPNQINSAIDNWCYGYRGEETSKENGEGVDAKWERITAREDFSAMANKVRHRLEMIAMTPNDQKLENDIIQLLKRPFEEAGIDYNAIEIHYGKDTPRGTIELDKVYQTGEVGYRNYKLESGFLENGHRQEKPYAKIVLRLPWYNSKKKREFTKCDWAHDYLRSVKTLDRKDVYDISLELGEKLAGRLSATFAQRRRINSKEHKEEVLSQSDVVYVTTPRGGHEVLSTFAYANGIEKAMNPASFPSDWQTSDELYETVGAVTDTDNYKEVFPMTWLGKAGYGKTEINHVVFIDDIVASAQQATEAHNYITKFFKQHGMNPEIHLVAIAGRRADRYQEYKSEFFDNALYGIELDNLNDWNHCRAQQRADKREVPPNCKPPSVAFPWSIPDGSADRPLVDVYGSRTKRGRIHGLGTIVN